jgi:hypothetical protein
MNLGVDSSPPTKHSLARPVPLRVVDIASVSSPNKLEVSPLPYMAIG